MKVELLNYTPNGEMTIAQAGKLCYSPVGVDEIKNKTSEKEAEKFVSMLARLGHESPIEHVSFTFAIEGVSRALTHQLVRHRLASYSQQSQRYVKLDSFEYIMPPSIENNEKAREIFVQQMESAAKSYGEIVDSIYEDNYNEAIQMGNSDKQARSIAEKTSIEDARYVFPNACETKIVMTMNARTLLHFFSVRTCNRAQWEIRNLAIAMLKLVKHVYPGIFQNAGPGCIGGPCPEGPMTCGKIEEVREYFGDL